jgi:hypothetical protein
MLKVRVVHGQAVEAPKEAKGPEEVELAEVVEAPEEVAPADLAGRGVVANASQPGRPFTT